ncbi:MAG: hypothetical protein WC480_02795 [Patescibacteria group bacterium]
MRIEGRWVFDPLQKVKKVGRPSGSGDRPFDHQGERPEQDETEHGDTPPPPLFIDDVVEISPEAKKARAAAAAQESKEK